MLLVNTDSIPGKKLEVIGLVSGNHIHVENVSLMRSTLTKSDLDRYAKTMNHARKMATEKMIEEAKKLGANVILNVKFSTSNIVKASSGQKGYHINETIGYGTAAKIVKCK